MEWEFKLNPGDVVWFMYNNQAMMGKITKAWYKKSISCVDYESVSENEKYYVSLSLNGSDFLKVVGDYELKNLFPDKESLLKSL